VQEEAGSGSSLQWGFPPEPPISKSKQPPTGTKKTLDIGDTGRAPSQRANFERGGNCVIESDRMEYRFSFLLSTKK
jgi:hypothetical protein